VALLVADQAGLPVMVHIDEPPPTYEEVVAKLRPGDILTHCFRPFPNAPIDGAGKIRAGVRAARERGVLFDIGHGKGAFAWKSARAAMAEGFPPDTISSDVHTLCVDGPAFDQVTTMSKFLCLGMSLSDIIAASTVNAARALRRPELGSLKPGSAGDASILSLEEGRFPLVDVLGEVVESNRRFLGRGLVIGGSWWNDPAAPEAAAREVVQA
jgi:dihydroorotase